MWKRCSNRIYHEGPLRIYWMVGLMADQYERFIMQIGWWKKRRRRRRRRVKGSVGRCRTKEECASGAHPLSIPPPLPFIQCRKPEEGTGLLPHPCPHRVQSIGRFDYFHSSPLFPFFLPFYLLLPLVLVYFHPLFFICFTTSFIVVFRRHFSFAALFVLCSFNAHR